MRKQAGKLTAVCFVISNLAIALFDLQHFPYYSDFDDFLIEGACRSHPLFLLKVPEAAMMMKYELTD